MYIYIYIYLWPDGTLTNRLMDGWTNKQRVLFLGTWIRRQTGTFSDRYLDR